MQVIFRVDASTQIGTGHVMRCLALAQAWHDTQGQPIFVMTTSVPALEERLKSEGMHVVHLTTEPGSLDDAEQITTLAHQFGATWVVVDGYHFGGEYQQILKQSKLHLLFIDDYGHAEHYYADFVLNQNISADEQWYNNREPYTQLLLGSRYALLRQEFWQWRGWQRTVPQVAKKVLVTLGGADPDNVTLKVIQSLQIVEVEELEAVVVVGGSNPHYENLKMAVLDSRYPIQLQRNVTNMPELMAWADVAISAGGSTCWELAFMGLPSILLILAENQRAIAEKLATLNLAINLGWHQDVESNNIAEPLSVLLQSTAQRINTIEVSQQIVDGEGVFRILKSLEANSLQLRPVREEDCELIWHWVNTPEVRNSAFNSEHINWENHFQWFKNKLTSKTCFIFIVEDIKSKPIGQIRFEIIDNKEAEIDISIENENRGKGLASIIINKGISLLSQKIYIEVIHSFIKAENQASIRAFEKNNFALYETKIVKGHLAHHYILHLKMLKSTNYILVGSKPWNESIFKQKSRNTSNQWYLIKSLDQLNLQTIQSINPRYIFFLHWSWKVPEEIIANYECVCFHMTDVPYGRGGSPLQNLIIRGHQQTKLTALRMTQEFDAGPVYLKEDLVLGGNAEEIYIRATTLAAKMIEKIVAEEPTPIPQTGEVTIFKRRKPAESEIPELSSLSNLHDFIRMLDAERYPKAFIEHQGFHYEFSRSALYDGRIVADVTITKIEDKQE